MGQRKKCLGSARRKSTPVEEGRSAVGGVAPEKFGTKSVSCGGPVIYYLYSLIA